MLCLTGGKEWWERQREGVVNGSRGREWWERLREGVVGEVEGGSGGRGRGRE